MRIWNTIGLGIGLVLGYIGSGNAQVTVQCPSLPCTITVTGPPPATPSIAPLSLTFLTGISTDSGIQVTIVSNPTNAAIPVTYTNPVAPFFWGGMGTCGTTVPANGSCTLSFRYHPTNTNAVTGSVVITVAGKATTLTLKGSVPVAHTVQLQWTPAANTTSSTLYRGTIAGGPYGLSIPGLATSYLDSPPAGTYYYVVKGVNDKGESDASNEARAIIP